MEHVDGNSWESCSHGLGITAGTPPKVKLKFLIPYFGILWPFKISVTIYILSYYILLLGIHSNRPKIAGKQEIGFGLFSDVFGCTYSPTASWLNGLRSLVKEIA